jgi:mRNA interferase RelE/StbE
MAWRIELSALARKHIADLDPQIRARVLRFLNRRVAKLDNPRAIGGALTGSELGAFWKYRAGDIRIIADIQDDRLCVLVVRVGNRKDVYR